MVAIAASASASSSTTTVATPLRRSWTAAPPRSARPTGTPVNALTVSGPETYANASLVITTWSTRPSINAGPDTHGPTAASTVGTTPDASVNARATRPHAWSDATPSPTSAPEVAMAPTTGTPSSTPRRTARSSASPSATPIAPRCFPPSSRNQLTVRPWRSESAVVTASLRCTITGAAGVGEKSGVTCPLRSLGCGEHEGRVVPAEPERVRERGLCADLARRARDHVQLDVVAEPLEVGGRRDDAVPHGQERGDGFHGTGGADQVTGHTLGGRDGRRGVAEHLPDGLGLGGVVQLRR